MKFSGKLLVDVVEIHFSIPGKISGIYKKVGEQISVGTALASLEKKLLQAELDRQIAAFEKVRAVIEINNIQHKNSNDSNEYFKSIQQADLNTSIKDVEIAKILLDQTDLFSPVAGQIIEDGGNRVGSYITPTSSSFKIQDSSSFSVKFELSAELAPRYLAAKPTVIHLKSRKINSTSIPVVYINSKYSVSVPISQADSAGLLPGSTAIVEIA